MSIVNTEKLFKEHYRVLCHYAWQYLNDIEQAKDLVQDVFVNFHQRISTFANNQDEDYLKNYLYLSVKNSCFNLLKKRKVVEKYWNEQNSKEEYELTTEINIIRSEVLAAIYAAIETLPQSCQLIFKKTYIDGLSNIEVAKELNLSINTIKTQKQRGLKAIKVKLSPELLTMFLLIF